MRTPNVTWREPGDYQWKRGARWMLVILEGGALPVGLLEGTKERQRVMGAAYRAAVRVCPRGVRVRRWTDKLLLDGSVSKADLDRFCEAVQRAVVEAADRYLQAQAGAEFRETFEAARAAHRGPQVQARWTWRPGRR